MHYKLELVSMLIFIFKSVNKNIHGLFLVSFLQNNKLVLLLFNKISVLIFNFFINVVCLFL